MDTIKGKRTIGLDMHPDVFSAAALSGDNPLKAHVEWRHDRLEQVMIKELCADPKRSKLRRLMGIRHCVAFALIAIVRDINRFPTANCSNWQLYLARSS